MRKKRHNHVRPHSALCYRTGGAPLLLRLRQSGRDFLIPHNFRVPARVCVSLRPGVSTGSTADPGTGLVVSSKVGPVNLRVQGTSTRNEESPQSAEEE